jgi:hypothetical protein
MRTIEEIQKELEAAEKEFRSLATRYKPKQKYGRMESVDEHNRLVDKIAKLKTKLNQAKQREGSGEG